MCLYDTTFLFNFQSITTYLSRMQSNMEKTLFVNYNVSVYTDTDAGADGCGSKG